MSKQTESKTYTLADAIKLVTANESQQQVLNAIMLQADGPDLISEAATAALAKNSAFNPAVLRAQLHRVPIEKGEQHWTIKLDKAANAYKVQRTNGRAPKAKDEKSLDDIMRELIDTWGAKAVSGSYERVFKKIIEEASKNEELKRAA